MIVQNWWFTTLLKSSYKTCPALQKDLKCDVLIIGGGMSGVSAACEFIDKGLKVILIEKNILGGSSSGKSAGFLTPDSELELSQLVRRFGIKGANEIWSAPVKGIDLIVNNVRKHNISCDFRVQDSLFLGIGNSGLKDVQDEIRCRENVGFTNQELYSKDGLDRILKSEGFLGAVRYNDTYGINCLQYLQGMKSVLIENGIEIYENTEVHSINQNIAYTHAGSIKADQIIVAIDKMEKSISEIADEIYHAQTFLSVSEPLSDAEVNQLFPSGKEYQMWDNTLVYSYWRLIEENRILLGGGSATTTFLRNPWYNDSVINGVHKRFKKHFDFLNSLRFIQYWPGLIDTSRDLLPILVRDDNNKSIHFIQGVVGLPWASFCGHLVAKNILNESTEENLKYYEYFSDRRYFALPIWMEKFIGKPFLFSLNNGWAKYNQVDKKDRLRYKKNEF
jgi:gamma-glutamylputrescine oxidase